MKPISKLGLLGVMALTSACASNKKPTADVNASRSSVVADSIVPGSQADLERYAGDRVYFAYDQYTLTPSARDTLVKQAEWLKQYPNAKILIAGNCDERGTREYNLALGARRAEAARAFLESQGVAGVRMTTISYGKERPIDQGSNESAWSRNRNAFTGVSGASS